MIAETAQGSWKVEARNAKLGRGLGEGGQLWRNFGRLDVFGAARGNVREITKRTAGKDGNRTGIRGAPHVGREHYDVKRVVGERLSLCAGQRELKIEMLCRIDAR